MPRSPPLKPTTAHGINFKALDIYAFLGRLMRDVPRYLVNSLLSLFLYVGMIFPVCQSFRALPEHLEHLFKA